jgi:hypothetical protein
MNSSENAAYAMPYGLITFFAKIQGAGAAAPVRAPTTFSATSSIGFMHASNNFAPTVATDITRSGAGAYTMKLRDSVPVMLNIIAECWGPAATGKDIVIQDYNPTTRVVTFASNLEATGAATDLAAADFVVFTFIGSKDTPSY